MGPPPPSPRTGAQQRPEGAGTRCRWGPPTSARGLVTALGTWSALSIAGGSALWARGRSPMARSFGRQTLGWGVVDAGVAAWGAARPAPDPRRLRRVLAVNAAVEVGYVGIGLWLMRTQEWRGDGAAIVVQGAFLLALDSHVAFHLEVPDGA